MESCNCIGMHGSSEDMMKYQYVSDFFIALAYFAIPVELFFFAKKSALLPYKWVLLQFGAFIVLCGTTHLINLWTYSAHPREVDVAMTVAKISCAIVSFATALTLVRSIPEQFLNKRVEELDKEKGLLMGH